MHTVFVRETQSGITNKCVDCGKEESGRRSVSTGILDTKQATKDEMVE